MLLAFVALSAAASVALFFALERAHAREAVLQGELRGKDKELARIREEQGKAAAQAEEAIQFLERRIEARTRELLAAQKVLVEQERSKKAGEL